MSALKDTLPPPLPHKIDSDPLPDPSATRLSRFFARLFDVWWEVLLLTLLFGFVLSRYSVNFSGWINSPHSAQLFAIICVPFAMILDAAVYGIFGNTPGKALLKLKVTTWAGDPLSFAQYVSRNFLVWFSGLALGLPFINLFTFAFQARRLGMGQQASYDEATGFLVRAAPSGFVVKAAFSLAFTSLFGVMIALRAIESDIDHAAPSSESATYYSWMNPQTRQVAMIDSWWYQPVQYHEAGEEMYDFSHWTNRAKVVLAVQQEPRYTLVDYVRVFRKHNAAVWRFSDEGHFFEKDGHRGWQGTGMETADPTIRFKVEVFQMESGIGRLVSQQTQPYDLSDLPVSQIQASLWSTIR